ncbi:MAG TPA: hypothetical protein PKA58_12335 [Polyangium sp.]|jgi:Tol biopolymer transport system component|nr:hypothetical protein [Polyangium sp.]
MANHKTHFHSLTLGLVGTIATAAALSGASCSSDPTNSSSNSSSSGAGGSAGGGSSSSGQGGDGGGFIDPGTGPFGDFPKAPVVLDGLDPAIATLFGDASGMPTGGPCLSEPPMDAMFPRNWTPLFFEWSSPPELNVFELRLEVDNQVNPLIIYTTQPFVTMDAAVWKGLAGHSAGKDVKVTIRGAHLENGALTVGPSTGTTGAIHIAPVAAPGSVVYWTSTGGTSFQGFTIGDTTSKTVLSPPMAGPTSTGGNTTCVSCHTSSPDGKLIIYSRDADNGTRAVDARYVTGGVPGPDVISPSALALLGRNKQTAPVLSPAHYSPSDAVAISILSDPALNGGRYEIVWTNLHATDGNGWGVLARNGDPRFVASSPAWRRDGNEIAYVTSAAGGEGVIASVNPADPTMDINTIPYNDRAGGDAKPFPGASDPNYHEFYPVYSPDDTFLAFNRTDNTPPDSYSEPAAEVFIVPGAGGTPTRLRANDPPACTGLVSPGLTNAWARWAPKAETYQGLKYYWVVFSSNRRAAASLRPQLYVAAVVTKADAGAESLVAEYPAIYATAQDAGGNNHTPAWDFFEVEQIPPK